MLACLQELKKVKLETKPSLDDEDENDDMDDSGSELESLPTPEPEDAVYEVDAIKWAKYRDSRRDRAKDGYVGWHYGVMWNGYLKSLSETEEPLSSFDVDDDNSTSLVDEFWQATGRPIPRGRKEPKGRLGEVVEPPRPLMRRWLKECRPRRNVNLYYRRRDKAFANPPQPATKADSDYYWNKKRKAAKAKEKKRTREKARASSRGSSNPARRNGNAGSPPPGGAAGSRAPLSELSPIDPELQSDFEVDTAPSTQQGGAESPEIITGSQAAIRKRKLNRIASSSPPIEILEPSSHPDSNSRKKSKPSETPPPVAESSVPNASQPGPGRLAGMGKIAKRPVIDEAPLSPPPTAGSEPTPTFGELVPGIFEPLPPPTPMTSAPTAVTPLFLPNSAETPISAEEKPEILSPVTPIVDVVSQRSPPSGPAPPAPSGPVPPTPLVSTPAVPNPPPSQPIPRPVAPPSIRAAKPPVTLPSSVPSKPATSLAPSGSKPPAAPKAIPPSERPRYVQPTRVKTLDIITDPEAEQRLRKLQARSGGGSSASAPSGPAHAAAPIPGGSSNTNLANVMARLQAQSASNVSQDRSQDSPVAANQSAPFQSASRPPTGPRNAAFVPRRPPPSNAIPFTGSNAVPVPVQPKNWGVTAAPLGASGSQPYAVPLHAQRQAGARHDPRLQPPSNMPSQVQSPWRPPQTLAGGKSPVTAQTSMMSPLWQHHDPQPPPPAAPVVSQYIPSRDPRRARQANAQAGGVSPFIPTYGLFPNNQTPHPLFSVPSFLNRRSISDQYPTPQSPDHPSSDASGSRRVEVLCDLKAFIQGVRPDSDETFSLRIARGAPDGTDPGGDEILSKIFASQTLSKIILEEMEFHHLEAAFQYGANVTQWMKVTHQGPGNQDAWESLKRRSRRLGKIFVTYTERLDSTGNIAGHYACVMVHSDNVNLDMLGYGDWSRPEVNMAMLVVSLPMTSSICPKLPNPVRPDFGPNTKDQESHAQIELYGLSDAFFRSYEGKSVVKYPDSEGSYDFLYNYIRGQYQANHVQPIKEGSFPEEVLFSNSRIGRTVRSTTLRTTCLRRTKFHMAGPSLHLPPSQWLLREVWATGGLVTFSPTFILRSPEKFEAIMQILRCVTHWAAYIIPSVIIWAESSWREPACPDPPKSFGTLSKSLFHDTQLARIAGPGASSGGGLIVSAAPPSTHLSKDCLTWITWLRSITEAKDYPTLLKLCQPDAAGNSLEQKREWGVVDQKAEQASTAAPAVLDLVDIELAQVEDLTQMRMRPHLLPYRRYIYVGECSLDGDARRETGNAVEFVAPDDFAAIFSGAV